MLSCHKLSTAQSFAHCFYVVNWRNVSIMPIERRLFSISSLGADEYLISIAKVYVIPLTIAYNFASSEFLFYCSIRARYNSYVPQNIHMERLYCTDHPSRSVK